MLVQTYPIQSKEEAVACIDAGADIVGFVVDGQDLEMKYGFEISDEDAVGIVNAVKGRALTTMICNTANQDILLKKLKKIHPDMIHLCAGLKGSRELTGKIRSITPDIRIMESLPVKDESSIMQAVSFSEYTDIIMLDSPGIDETHSGATGAGHSRKLDKAIMEKVDRPVIVAGGLGPENIAQLLKEMQPYGVDTLTKTSVVENGKIIKKDLDKLRRFAEIVHSCGICETSQR